MAVVFAPPADHGTLARIQRLDDVWHVARLKANLAADILELTPNQLARLTTITRSRWRVG